MDNVQVVSVESVEWNDFHIIDVRSPSEFREFHINGAINVPIFSNEERAKVGTMYKQVGKEEAKMLGLSIVSPKLVEMVSRLKDIHHSIEKPILVYCARGGMRSSSFATVMSLMGLPCYQLQGGIRAYRQKIVSGLRFYHQNQVPFVVLEGLTGSRKTDILERLSIEGYPVLNLEEMAGHRGSIFGQVGTEAQSQKAFDRNLYDRLSDIGETDYYLIESESKRIGKVIIPDWILSGKAYGKRIHIHYPFEKRVQAICATYKPEDHHDHLGEALQRLKKRMKPELFHDLMNDFQKHQYENVVRVLLEHYYDPRYQFTADQYVTSPTHVHMEDLGEGLAKVREILQDYEQFKNVRDL
ncbi:tRNA 2-selenouridine(34) synthase MnmH [Pseudalkalibacillus sp. Hm43]|uniref:tRNA 2-selenouridine(34) synthase MnmH n=1 Tax=Pseudalkalibacillus sp. Hm43 TaxID=3450742 RepID=UPI003F4341E0